jgi:hypothetical protein
MLLVWIMMDRQCGSRSSVTLVRGIGILELIRSMHAPLIADLGVIICGHVTLRLEKKANANSCVVMASLTKERNVTC